ncbi:MAG: ribonuclease Z [Weeksellaceae bacterium]|nr:ribonuclease Z [Weeksellaceae bacterium]
MGIKLTILGYNSAIPTAFSHPTSQLLNINERYILIDCGEGTQVQLRRAKIKFSKINHIFISHLHGDHVFGLVGLISTFQLLGRKKELQIFGPVGIEDFIMNQLRHTKAHCNYPLTFHELDHQDPQLIYEDKKILVYTIPLNHRIYCNGYLVKEKAKLRHLKIEEIEKYPEIQRTDYLSLKQGNDFISSSGQVIPNAELTSGASQPESYAFCSDTMYKPELAELLRDVSCMYHEATFMHESQDRAIATGHSTAIEAATIARDANAGSLIIGHFSNRYMDLNPLLEEAQSVFPNTHLPKMLLTLDIKDLVNAGV